MTKLCDFQFFPPYLGLVKSFDTLFMTVAAGAIALNILYEAFVDGRSAAGLIKTLPYF